MITVDLRRPDIRPGDWILDMGCGSGRHVAAAHQLEDVNVIGADLSLDDLEATRERLRFHDTVGACGRGSWAICNADINRLPFADAFFDLVICSEVLEHIPSHEKALAEVVRVLKPGRDLIVSVPRQWPERICWALSDRYFNVNQGHVRIYTKKELVSLLEKAGVKPWAGHFAHSLHAPYWWLKCLVGPQRDDSWIVNLYNRFLTWDMMQKPRITGVLDRLLNPLMGKSIVIYSRKQSAQKP